MDVHAAYPTFTILCVDDDKDFLNYLITITGTYNISLITAETIAEGKKKVAKEQYDAYIVDLKLPDGSGYEVIEAIRRQGNRPIAVISGAFRDEIVFRTLKEQYLVNYVLEKPILPFQIDHLLSDLSQTKIAAKEEHAKTKLEILQENYTKTICNRIDEISKLIKTAQEKQDSESTSQFISAIHKMGGSAGSYGYLNVSNLCKELESQYRFKIEAKEPLDSSWYEGLNNFIRMLKYHYQVTPSVLEGEILSKDSPITSRSSIFLIGNDKPFTELIERENSHYDLDIVFETNPQLALKHIESPDFNPRIFIVCQNYPGSKITGYDLIQAIKKKTHYLPTLYCMLMDNDSLDKRVEAVNNEIKYIFRLPCSPITLLEILTQILLADHLKNFKVLVLDDDLDLCALIGEMLKEIGIEVTTINDPIHLFSTLNDQMPHLLILDVILPRYNGIQLLEAIRSDIAYRNLAVIIVTHSKDPELMIKAYSKDADDVLYKPLKKEAFQKRILEMAKRYVISGKTLSGVVAMGLKPLKALESRLGEILSLSADKPQHLILFEFENLTQMILTKGKIEVHDFFVTVANLILSQTNNMMSCYFIEPARFAIIYNSSEIEKIQTELETLLRKTEQLMNWKMAVICSITPISKKYKQAKNVLQAGTESLAKARVEGGASPIKIHITEKIEQETSNKEIVIVDPDIELVDLITFSMQPYQVKIKSFGTGEEALAYLFGLNENSLPALIIVERKLPDMDGLNILIKMQERFRVQIPLIFLTLFSSDYDVSVGLKQGAIEYIKKPFNLSILILLIRRIIDKKIVDRG